MIMHTTKTNARINETSGEGRHCKNNKVSAKTMLCMRHLGKIMKNLEQQF